MPALADKFRFEPDRGAVGDDLQIMVGQARQQRTAGHFADMGDRIGDAAFLAQRFAEIADRRIFDPAGEIEQHAVRAEIDDAFRIKILDRRIGATAQQRHPVIIGAHMHPPFVGADIQPRLIDARIFDIRVVMAGIDAAIQSAGAVHWHAPLGAKPPIRSDCAARMVNLA